MTTKQVMITKAEVERFGNQPIQVGLHFMHRLAEVGIPATGIIWPQGVKHGEMTARFLPDGVLFKWNGDEAEDEESLF